MIELSQVSKDFRTGQKLVHAVRSVSLSVEKGEIFGIIGFSGAGKSTLVRCINLLERPTSGTVTVDGQVMTSLSAGELRQARKKNRHDFPALQPDALPHRVQQRCLSPARKRTEKSADFRKSACTA